ncbi:tripartite tricarboxylate transporter substrate binding protein [Pusillimonas sp. ANT_WB101]|uniref:Bug family tripartite tricarboxylate transporter substrate binding protein n=1 Tax=Pusillimonas sp. ANT_WB101 TaxID=2597356 RepID=UPI0011EC0345|nr:tripartite tricarboxylate transporter substrate binding protein [Pusillimonas sp. ANT_WB101]KAA0911542.1 tripartite tricarboxylate transporter substrate binding protein [Pusillimonas sp. ANT_WB101]
MKPASISGTPFKALTALALVLAATSAFAQQGYPDRAITMVVPYPPGGTTDIIARTLAHAMETELKQTIVAENRAGAGGNIGMGHLAQAKPDGYTIGVGTIGTQTINQFLYTNMAFNPESDFAPIALVGTTPNVIAVNAQSKIHTVKDLIEAAKAQKEKPLSYGTPGIGSSVHLTGAYFEQAAGVKLLHVPFKGVSGSMPALIGGQIDILMDNLPSTLSQIKDGSKVRGIAVTSAERAPSLPDLPTVAESGLPGFDVTAWFALYAPKNTPQDRVDRLIEAARSALASEKLITTFATSSLEPGTLFGSDLASFETKERTRWQALIKSHGIQAQ